METTSDHSEASFIRQKKVKISNTRKYNVPDIRDPAHSHTEEGDLSSTNPSSDMLSLSLLDKRNNKLLHVSNMRESGHVPHANSDKDGATPETFLSLPIRASISPYRKKLLILDLNGLLADIVPDPPKDCRPDIKISRRAIFKRPFYLDFLKFCFERFEVGIWSSRARKNVDRVVEYLLGDMKRKLLFCWDLSHCTATQFSTLENRHKALVFKELRQIWEKHDPKLPWEKGYYNESNTLLVDDSPYKALLNPAHTAIFPYPYQFQDVNDNSLGKTN
uniref:Mitochondrial import inner membrane translocase subunit TIM50 n=1 Tax=Rhizophora mucronata TaxID=61149 RepID=A0A2P2JT09_RHIMU